MLVDLRCPACNLMPFDPYAYELRSAQNARGIILASAYVFAPREGFCRVERHYPGYGEED